MWNLYRLIITGLVCLCLCTQSLGQTLPETIPYQGFLANASGEPVEGQVNLTFSIYDGPTSNVPIWQEVQRLVSVRGGAFSVYLGSIQTAKQKY